MKVSLNGKKLEFSHVLANWLVKDAKYWTDGEEPKGSVPSDWSQRQLQEVMDGWGARDLHRILQIMVSNRVMFEVMIAFAVRYKSAVMRAKVEDIQEALDLIEVMGVQQK